MEEALRGLPDPRLPHDIPNHVFIPPPRRIEKRISRLGWGKAAVYYSGADGKVFKTWVRLNPYKPAPTVMGRSRFIHPFEDRVLTVREQARLMGFPDYHVFKGSIESQYDQVGEAVPVPLARAVAREVLKHLRRKWGNT